MTLEPSVIAPVLNHPSLPLDDLRGLEISDEDALAVRERLEPEGLTASEYLITIRSTRAGS